MWLTWTNLEKKGSYRGHFFLDFCILKEKITFLLISRGAVFEKQMAATLVMSMWEQKLRDDIWRLLLSVTWRNVCFLLMFSPLSVDFQNYWKNPRNLLLHVDISTTQDYLFWCFFDNFPSNWWMVKE